MHPEGLPCSHVLVTEVTGHSGSLDMFGLDVIDHVSGHVAHISTHTALVSFTSLHIHRLDGPIKLLKGIKDKTCDIYQELLLTVLEGMFLLMSPQRLSCRADFQTDWTDQAAVVDMLRFNVFWKIMSKP